MELDFVEWLRGRSAPTASISLTVGDDAAALLFASDHEAIVTTDMLMDGTDFLVAEHAPERIGRKALAVNLSDLAAMGASPVAAFVSLALPEDSAELARRLMTGVMQLSEEFACPIAGGDTNVWRGPLVINVTAIGECPRGCAWKRSGLQLGDEVWATGSFGGSIHGKHFDFTPRLREAAALRTAVDVHAAIDVSDGLSLDLWRLVEASGCGVEFFHDEAPIAPAALLDDRRTPLEHALADGEDFELIFAVSPADGAKLRESPPFPTPLTCIGRVVREPGAWLRGSVGAQLLPKRGYVHGQV